MYVGLLGMEVEVRFKWVSQFSPKMFITQLKSYKLDVVDPLYYGISLWIPVKSI